MAQDRVEAVERALEVLNSFTNKSNTLSLKDISESTGFYKSTILRLIGSLEAYGYILRQQDGRYRLGPSLWRLGSIYQNSFDSETAIRPLLQSVRDQINQTAAFYIRSGNQRICLYRENAIGELCHMLSEGAELPLDKGAAGMILTAFGGADGEAMDSIREKGWYLSEGERNPDLAALAVPVITENGELKGVLSVSGLIFKFTEEKVNEYLPILKKTATQLGKELANCPLM
ncbi:IclR family transcriptional regulator [Marinomonas arenicola]|uniref:IclR family transcriptional regulator n=1 Tax=Marinomonas arenicola TaxID=569601 RepID=UPI00311D4838